MLFNQAIDIPDALHSERVNVSLIGERARYNLRLKKEDLAGVKKATGLNLPSKICESSITTEKICMKLGPDEWVIITAPNAAPTLNALFTQVSKDYMCSVTDISHRNIAFKISGQDAVKLVNVGCPLDMSLKAFPVGKARRTLFESAQITLLRTGEDCFTLETWRSFGPYLRDYFLRVLTTR